MSDSGKGSSARPYYVPLAKFDSNLDLVFGKKKEACDCQQGQCKEGDAARCRDWNKRGGR